MNDERFSFLGPFAYDFDGEPIGMARWQELFHDPARVFAQDKLGKVFLSTVWLGIDHGFGFSERPLIFETMVFKPEGEETYRYATREEALAGHARLLAELRLLEEATKSGGGVP